VANLFQELQSVSFTMCTDEWSKLAFSSLEYNPPLFLSIKTKNKMTVVNKQFTTVLLSGCKCNSGSIYRLYFEREHTLQ